MKEHGSFKGKRKFIVAAVLLLTLIVGAAAVTAASSEPGSESDPIVTKSYVDSAIASALGSQPASGSSDSYEVVFVEAGKKVIAKGCTEMILRSGEAAAIDNGANGVSDMTSGTDLKMNYTVRANHLLLVPRDDGRGIRTKTDCYIMIRGPYEIK